MIALVLTKVDVNPAIEEDGNDLYHRIKHQMPFIFITRFFLASISIKLKDTFIIIIIVSKIKIYNESFYLIPTPSPHRFIATTVLLDK